MTISVLPADWAVVTGSKAKARTPKIIAGNCAIVLIGPNQNGSSVGAGQAASRGHFSEKQCVACGHLQRRPFRVRGRSSSMIGHSAPACA